MRKNIVIVRSFKGIGIDAQLRGYDMNTGATIERKVYNGRLCYIHEKERVGLKTLKAHPCRIIIKEYQLPF